MDLSGATDLVLEFLLFRGYTKSFRSLLREQSDDPTCAFRSSAVVDQLFQYIYQLDLQAFQDLWNFLDARFFAHLDREHAMAMEKCRQRLLRLYVVTCIKKQKREEAKNFFSRFAAELDSSSRVGAESWRTWFAVPFLSDPQNDAEFHVFFQDDWASTLREALYNAFSMVLSSTRLPKLLLLEKWYQEGRDASKSINQEVSSFRQQLETLSDHAAESGQRLSTLQSLVKILAETLHREVALRSSAERDRQSARIAELGTATVKMAAALVADANDTVTYDLDKAQIEKDLVQKAQQWLREIDNARI